MMLPPNSPTLQRNTGVPASPQISEAAMKRYFNRSVRTLIGLLFLGLIGLIATIYGLNITSEYYRYSSYYNYYPYYLYNPLACNIFGCNLILLVGVILLANSVIRLALRLGATPSDTAYDTWVAMRPHAQLPAAYEQTGLHQSELLNEPPFIIRGFVFPDARNKARYGISNVKYHKGQDGIWRFSINTIIYILPVANRLVAYGATISAISQGLQIQNTYEYYYGDVVGQTTIDEQEILRLPRWFNPGILPLWMKFAYREVPIRIQQFALHISSGDTISVSVGFRAPSRGTKNLPEVHFSQDFIDTVRRIRTFIRSRKQTPIRN